MINWTTSNSKLVKTGNGQYKILGFGLQADHNFLDASGKTSNTCPAALACKDPCYAKQGSYLFPVVKRNRTDNIISSLDTNFVDSAIQDLNGYKKKKYNVVRIHDSGDFYSREYLDKWYSIARAHGDMLFYAYTKSLHLDVYNGIPDNFRITQSLGGRYDNLVDMGKPHSRIFNNDASRIAAGYVDGNIDDMPAIIGEIKIGLVYHGNKKLTPSQDKYFSFNII